MEFSSPLAALRPQPYQSWAFGNDFPASRTMYGGCGVVNFDFRNMSMHQKPLRQDYFTTRPVRGSSPTATLTADLSANFHIDQSPQAPTPRRSLFTSDLLNQRTENHGQLDTPPIAIEPAMTPPIPSSSPYFDSMDISPLPHKLPHFVAQITLPSPTPDCTDFPLLDPTETPNMLPVQPPPFLQLPERRRPVTRPSLSRPKAASANNILLRPSSAETQVSPFRFGNVASSGSSSPSMPIVLDSFTESPVDDLVQTSNIGSMLPPPRRPTVGTSSRCNGSPSSGHIRKPSGGRPAFVRPQRKLIRRSLSMFQHPTDVMKEEQAAFERQPSMPSSIMDIQQEYVPKLPSFVPEGEPDSLPRITPETMADVLDGKFSAQFAQTRVIDCRFEYEYNGGHITVAENHNDKEHLAAKLFDGTMPANSLLIFHCEYSVHRAPLSAKFIRNHDRKVNAAQYPLLTHQEMYVLDGGYKGFYERFPEKCEGSYVEMNDERHELACERGMAKVKSQRQKLFRHSTFAFGDTAGHDAEMEDSPSAPSGAAGRMAFRSHSSFEMGSSPSSFDSLAVASPLGNPFQRRLASY